MTWLCALTLVGLSGLSGTSASASSEIQNLTLSECAKDFCAVARGVEGFISVMSPIVAAGHVDLEVVKKDSQARTTYQCESLAYRFSSSLLTCERTSATTLLIDFANSQIREF